MFDYYYRMRMFLFFQPVSARSPLLNTYAYALTFLLTSTNSNRVITCSAQISIQRERGKERDTVTVTDDIVFRTKLAFYNRLPFVVLYTMFYCVYLDIFFHFISFYFVESCDALKTSRAKHSTKSLINIERENASCKCVKR